MCAAAQTPVGVWDGTLSVQGTRLPLVFRITALAEGLAAALDSPDQGAVGIPVDSVAFRDGELTLGIRPIGATFRGSLLSDDLLLGDSGHLTVTEYPGLNHLLQPCTTGDLSEYETIEVTLSEQVLSDLVAWIRAQAAE